MLTLQFDYCLYTVYLKFCFLLCNSTSSNYADDNSLYNTGKDLELVKSVLVNDLKRSHYMCIRKNTESEIFKFKNMCLENSQEEKILGISIDSKFTFDSHIKSICRKADQKLSALSRISPYLEIDKKELLLLLIW